MLILILSVFINLIIIYIVYKRINTKIETPHNHNRDIAEINSLMVEFNKLTKNNIDLIEEKIEEIKQVIKIADTKILQFIDKTKNNFNSEDKILPNEKKIKTKIKKQDKYKSIQELLKRNKTPEQIAAHLGISISEVKLYINLIQEKR